MEPAAGPLSLVVHASGLGLIGISVTRSFGWLGQPSRRRRKSLLVFPVVIGIAALLLGVLHGLEASLWAVAYVWLGASPDFTNAVCFSLQMLTTLGVNIVAIEARWKLMEPLEAMSGMLLFGLSTAFLLADLQRAWPIVARERKYLGPGTPCPDLRPRSLNAFANGLAVTPCAMMLSTTVQRTASASASNTMRVQPARTEPADEKRPRRRPWSPAPDPGALDPAGDGAVDERECDQERGILVHLNDGPRMNGPGPAKCACASLLRPRRRMYSRAMRTNVPADGRKNRGRPFATMPRRGGFRGCR
jgi:hypothetical protein